MLTSLGRDADALGSIKVQVEVLAGAVVKNKTGVVYLLLDQFLKTAKQKKKHKNMKKFCGVFLTQRR